MLLRLPEHCHPMAFIMLTEYGVIPDVVMVPKGPLAWGWRSKSLARTVQHEIQLCCKPVFTTGGQCVERIVAQLLRYIRACPW